MPGKKSNDEPVFYSLPGFKQWEGQPGEKESPAADAKAGKKSRSIAGRLREFRRARASPGGPLTFFGIGVFIGGILLSASLGQPWLMPVAMLGGVALMEKDKKNMDTTDSPDAQ